MSKEARQTKLSELSTERLAQTLCELTPPLCRIARDPRMLAAFDTLALDGIDRQPALSAAVSVWEKVIPPLLGDHLEDLCAALAVLTGRSAAALRGQNGLATLRDLREVWDSDLRTFFISAGYAAQEKS